MLQTACTHTGCTAAVQLLASWQLISRFFSLHILTNNNHLKLFLHQTPIKTFPPFYQSHFHMWIFLWPFVKEVNGFFFLFLQLLLRNCSFEWFQDLTVNFNMAVPSKKGQMKAIHSTARFQFALFRIANNYSLKLPGPVIIKNWV